MLLRQRDVWRCEGRGPELDPALPNFPALLVKLLDLELEQALLGRDARVRDVDEGHAVRVFRLLPNQRLKRTLVLLLIVLPFRRHSSRRNQKILLHSRGEAAPPSNTHPLCRSLETAVFRVPISCGFFLCVTSAPVCFGRLSGAAGGSNALSPCSKAPVLSLLPGSGSWGGRLKTESKHSTTLRAVS
eukprot:300785-Rhodomonas_salina.2